MPAICRDCLAAFDTPGRCPDCGSPRLLRHAELNDLTIAHIDCDAFYASVEKRDDPDLADKPVIIGGGKRGVVSTACYVARIRGVKSAMPMFKALKLCPEAVVLKGRMDVYSDVSRDIRDRMLHLTPAVEPLSLDEAFLDLTGTQRLHGASPARMLAGLAAEIEAELGLSVSVGLSHNKFLAKIASDLDKPRGFSIIGRAETPDFLAAQPVGVIWGVGAVSRKHLEEAGIRRISDILRWDHGDLVKRFGGLGDRLYHLARGQDRRRVTARAPVKSISNETTFFEDTGAMSLLDGHLWRLSEKVADRAKARDLAGAVVTLKLKRADFQTLSRQQRLDVPTQLTDTIYSTARALLDRVADQGPFRLIGVGISHLSDAGQGDLVAGLLDPVATRRGEAERATDRIRARFGPQAIVKGRSLN
ncbi:DNA polymerase IV [Oceanomicrobium pacificus]|uniref:DNA polymerase IV n=1 Tax=Oceanomicrobium pacificus TaxID=2692916 RepID=A0A6B0TQN2_9RHOB|nr:DNA polymerase IV [Oceanomicrobium pacificus]MXU64999.1 DNA polymerase IV [Oceanomicrobium pacificus]